jgi:hypothetical protein
MRNFTRRMWVGVGALALSAAAFGPLLAQGRGGGGGGSKPDPTARQARPIQLGVSGGNATDIANGYCCSGTLGALVQDASRQYILSNSHVFAHDTAGGDVAQVGDPINQSGLIDVACQNRPADYVARLSTLSSLNPGAVSIFDAALAEVLPNMVDPNGAILGIGTISSTPVAASVNQSVKKAGRTTGLTSSRVEALNATISVGYTRECGGAEFTSMFNNQIIVSNRGQKFLAAGDSGSLMVENVSTNPRAIGLLFAGSSTIAVANPIGEILDHLKVSLVGQPTGFTFQAPDSTSQAAARAIEVQERNAARLFSVPGAIGHAVGLPENANAVVIKVYVTEATERARRAVPNEIEGVPVVLEAVGDVVALSQLPCGPKRVR